MILDIKGNVKRSYCETLCLLFFPGSKFPENEIRNDNTVVCSIDVSVNDIEVIVSSFIEKGSQRFSNSLKESLSSFDSIEKAILISVGRSVFYCGEKMTGIRPPYGIMTGVRPAKVASSMLDEGREEQAIIESLIHDYLVLPRKAQLVTDVAVTERRVVSAQSGKNCSIYIAIPFCPSRCSYCSFVSFTSPKLLKLVPEYLTLLLFDLHKTFQMIRENHFHVSTIYIGGGTPTTLDANQLEKLLTAVRQEIDVSSLEEFTLEAGRPDTITLEKLQIAKAFGVTRISVNPQTLNNDVLEHIGRKHSVEQFFSAFDFAKKSGIRDINVDLIAGLETDSFENFKSSIDQIITLAPTNITVHTFSVKNAAEIRRDNEDIYHESPVVASKSVAYSQDVLFEHDFHPYYMYRQKNMIGNLENVGYSLKGHEGLYNIYMMEEIHSIFGVGASSVTKFLKFADDGSKVIERFYEPKYPYEYLSDDRVQRWQDKSEKLKTFFSKSGVI